MPKELYCGLQIINVAHFCDDNYKITSSCYRHSYNDELQKNIEKVYARIRYLKQYAKLPTPPCGYHTAYEGIMFEDVNIFPKKYRKFFKIMLIQRDFEGKIITKEKKQ